MYVHPTMKDKVTSVSLTATWKPPLGTVEVLFSFSLCDTEKAPFTGNEVKDMSTFSTPKAEDLEGVEQLLPSSPYFQDGAELLGWSRTGQIPLNLTHHLKESWSPRISRASSLQRCWCSGYRAMQ